MPREQAKSSLDIGAGHEFGLRVDGFVWECLVEESDRIGVSIEELAAFAIAYYMADLDSGRTARRLPAFMRRALHGLESVDEGQPDEGQSGEEQYPH